MMELKFIDLLSTVRSVGCTLMIAETEILSNILSELDFGRISVYRRIEFIYKIMAMQIKTHLCRKQVARYRFDSATAAHSYLRRFDS